MHVAGALAIPRWAGAPLPVKLHVVIVVNAIVGFGFAVGRSFDALPVAANGAWFRAMVRTSVVFALALALQLNGAYFDSIELALLGNMTILVSIFVFAAQYACFSLTEGDTVQLGTGDFIAHLFYVGPFHFVLALLAGAVAATAAFRIQNDVLYAPLQWLAGR